MEEERIAVEGEQQSAEVKLQEVLKEKEQIEQRLSEATKGLATAQLTIKKRDQALKNQDELKTELKTVTEQMKMLAAFVSESQGRSADEFEQQTKIRKPDLLKQFDSIEQKKQIEKKQGVMLEAMKERQDKVEELGLTEEDEAYWEIFQLVTSAAHPDHANLKLADLKIKKIEKERGIKVEAPTENKETEEERISRLVDEKYRKKLEDSGALKMEGGTPSGGGRLSWESVNNMSAKEIKKLKQDHGVTELLDLVNKGVITPPK